MSVSMTLMSLTGVYRGLKAIIKLTSAETIKSTAVKLAEAAATRA
jgi:hypothetical protein